LSFDAVLLPDMEVTTVMSTICSLPQGGRRSVSGTLPR